VVGDLFLLRRGFRYGSNVYRFHHRNASGDDCEVVFVGLLEGEDVVSPTSNLDGNE
jgi:hypothetical protein